MGEVTARTPRTACRPTIRGRLEATPEKEAELVTEDEKARRREPGGAPDLRPVIARLDEIRRKCRSLRTRDDETEQASARLDRVITALASAAAAEDEAAPPYRELARQLFPVLRLFESLGFASVGRELSHVTKTLEGLEPETPADDLTGSLAPPPSPRRDAPPAPPVVASPTSEDELEERSRRRVPGPIAAMLVVLLLVVVAAIVLIRLDSQAGSPSAVRVAEPVVAVAPPLPATLDPSPAPTPPLSPTESEPYGAVVVAEEVAQARRALAEGDIDRAIHHVSQAALVDLQSSPVLETGQAIVRELLTRSDVAADAGRWDAASRLIERARELSIRFGFPLTVVDATQRRQGAMERFQVIAPGDATAIRDVIGRKVLLIDDRGRRREGRLRGVGPGLLQLEQFTAVGGGGRVYYLEDVPLSKVRELRVYQE